MQTHHFHIQVSLPSRRTLGFLAATTALLVGLGSVWAFDDNRGTSTLLDGGMVVPYDGFLMLDSSPVTGARDVMFELWDDDGDPDPGILIWAETQTVTFYNGRFSVGLGSGTLVDPPNRSIDEAILDADPLYLAIQIDDGGAWVPLSGRQAIEPVPYSAWTANATNLTVAGAENDGSTAALVVQSGTETMLVDGNDIQSSHELSLQSPSRGPTRVYGDLAVDGHLTAEGDVTVNGQLTFAGRNETQMNPNSGYWGDWYPSATGWYRCQANQYVCGFRFRWEDNQGGNDDTALNMIRLLCCTFGS